MDLSKKETNDDLEYLAKDIPVLGYLVLETSYYTKQQFKAYKSLEAFNQMVSGFVTSVQGKLISGRYVVVAKVRHSQRMNDPLVNIWIIAESDGTILSAHCLGCKAGLAESCSHVASVLFYIEAWIRINGKLACTQVKCSWLLPTYVNEVPYARIKDIDFSSAKKLKENLDMKIDSMEENNSERKSYALRGSSPKVGQYGGSNEWKLARVSPVFKKGTKTDLNNYRPISVIPLVAKIFERIVHDQLYQYLNNNNLLSSCQSGFRSLHSTLTALLEATNSWCVNIDKGFLNGVIFIDLKKAFDTIDHTIVIQKLAKYGLDRNSLSWFKSYLSNRSQQCSVNGHLSMPSQITCGVPQGSLIGPLLFLIYINDLPNSVHDGYPRMYADDTSISFAAASKTDLQKMVNNELKNINIWLKANKLSLNVAKTEFMVIGSRQRLKTQADCGICIHIEDKEIITVNSTKSLGLTIDETLSWAKHIDAISKKISSGIGALKRVRPFIIEESAAKIYHALIEPHFNYCSAVWDGLSQCLSDKLQKLQNRAARIVTNSSYDISAGPLLHRLGWERVATMRTKQKAAIMFKSINKLAPVYMQKLFSPRNSTYDFRNFENKLQLPKPNTEYLKRSISYSGAVLWNGLPHELRKTTSLARFKMGIDKSFSKPDSHTANT